MIVQLRSYLGRWQNIDGQNLERFRYTYTAFELCVEKTDEGARYNATNSE